MVYAGLTAKGYILFNNKSVTKTLNRANKPPCFMLRMYHPEIAGKVFDLVPRVGLYACEAIIRQDMSDVVHVEFIDPTIASPLARYHELEELAHRMKTDMMQVLQGMDDGRKEKVKAAAARPEPHPAPGQPADKAVDKPAEKTEPVDEQTVQRDAGQYDHLDHGSTVVMQAPLLKPGDES